MNPLALAILFCFGLAIGSFLNVVILRYDGEHFLLDPTMIGGRSHCPHCKATLRWFELVPVASYLAQGGRCRRCGARISAQYPAVELLSAFAFALVPLALGAAAGAGTGAIIAAALWIAAFETLVVMSVIDIRLGIIPDEASVFLGVIGIFLAIIGGEAAAAGAAFGALFGAALFGILVAVTSGKGMGMGDFKFAIALGLLFGWPEIVLAVSFAFVVGAAAGLVEVARGRNSMKGTIPFGPFLALAAAATFFWGAPVMAWYLSLLGAR